MGLPWDALGLLGEKVFRGRFMQQFAALLYKNVLVAWRSRRATAIRIVAPFVFLLLALIVNLALNANNTLQERQVATSSSTPAPISAIPACEQDLYIAGRACVDFVYTPSNDTVINTIVDSIMASNHPPIPEHKVKGFVSRREAEEYLVSHPDGSLGAVHFSHFSNGSVGYIVQSNSTVKYFKGSFQDPTLFFQVPMMNAVARELSRTFFAAAAAVDSSSNSAMLPALDDDVTGGVLSWRPQLVKFPHPSLQTSNLLGQVLSSFIFASLMFGFVTQMSNLVNEKSLGLRLALRNVGMLDSSYWVSWMMFDALITLVTSLLLVIFGIILQFSFFSKNDFGLLLLLFWLFSLAMTSFSYFLSVMIRKTQAAVYLGFCVFIVGWVFQTVIFVAKLPYSPAFYYSSSNRWGRVFFWVFNLFPWDPLTKGISDFNEATLSPSDPGLRWSQQYTYCSYQPDPSKQAPHNPTVEFRSYDCVYPMHQIYWNLVVQWVVYWALAAYLNNVVPNEVGTRSPVWFVFSPSYWRPRPADQVAAMHRVVQQEAAGKHLPPAADECPLEEDVAAEEDRMRATLLARTSAGNTEHLSSLPVFGGVAGAPRYAAELYGLRRVFRAPLVTCTPAGLNTCIRGQQARGPLRDFWAIRGTWLGIEEGQLFCLLGPNGAGKTTTINCLTGVLPFSGGDALVYGQPISSEGGLDAVRPLMGVCPQFDVLWSELTGREHLTIYGHIKGLPFTQVGQQASQLLGRVKLGHAAQQRSGSYSGGMKRRLSVALALLGDPKIVYLDEPTTGMDPISRRYVWDIIQDAKKGRAIVLTTHSMEEADVLGDRIGIMARGRLQAIGNSIRLKQKFGSGYQLTVHAATPRNAAYSALSAVEQIELAARISNIKQFFRHGLAAEPVDESRTLLRYLIGRAQEGQLVSFLSQLEQQSQQLGVDDIQASLSSLEEVFLNIAKRAELEAAAVSGNSLVSVELPDGSGELLVPLGHEEASHPSGDGRRYKVKWVQDDAGRLVVLDCVMMADDQQH